MTLYELTEQYQRLLEAIADPEFSWEDLEDTVDLIQDDFNTKADGYGRVIAQLKAEAEALRAEEIRLAELRRRREKGAEKLKERLLQALIETGQPKVQTRLFTFSTRRSTQLVVTDMAQVPKEFLRFKDPEVDKTELTKYLKANGEKAFAHLEEKHNLIIK